MGKSRLASTSARKDFLTGIIVKTEAGEVSREELTAHASTLVYDIPPLPLCIFSQVTVLLAERLWLHSWQL